MFSTGPFKWGDWKDLFIAHVIIIIKSEVSTFPIFFIFFRCCVPEMFVTSYSVTYCIYIPGKPGLVFISIVQFMMSANSRIRFGLQIAFVCLYITPPHCANFIGRHWPYKMPADIWFVECVSKIKHILSVIHYTIYGAVCFQFTHFLCDDWENIYTLSYYHHQIGSMSFCPLFRVRSWNNGMRWMSFYILMLYRVVLLHRVYQLLGIRIHDVGGMLSHALTGWSPMSGTFHNDIHFFTFILILFCFDLCLRVT